MENVDLLKKEHLIERDDEMCLVPVESMTEQELFAFIEQRASEFLERYGLEHEVGNL